MLTLPVSSAKVDVNIFIDVGISAAHKIYGVEPSTLPWGTPALIARSSNMKLGTLTVNFPFFLPLSNV